ncbi:hypothetical protein ACJX0J_015835, partial [Zea mays]
LVTKKFYLITESQSAGLHRLNFEKVICLLLNILIGNKIKFVHNVNIISLWRLCYTFQTILQITLLDVLSDVAVGVLSPQTKRVEIETQNQMHYNNLN